MGTGRWCCTATTHLKNRRQKHAKLGGRDGWIDRGGFFLPSFIVENRGGRTRRVSQNGDLQPEIDTMTTSSWYVDKSY